MRNGLVQKLISSCPVTGDILWSGPAASAADVAQAVRAAREAFRSWRTEPLSTRIAAARAFGTALQNNADRLATIIARETGKPLWEARQEVGSMAGKVELSISAQAERAGQRRTSAPFGEMVLRHQPHGVMAVLGPYNFPGHLPNGHIVPALLAGNTVVFKPSELTPLVGATMAEIWREADLPGGVLTVIQGGRETGEALVAAEIDGLLFTGSAATGMHLRRAFAERPEVILALELGGNNPLIVWDGDEAEAAAIAIQSSYITTGQRCSCARRLILPQGAFGDAIIERISDLGDALRIGAWNDDPEPYMGPLVSVRAAETARSQVDHLIALGARCLRPLAKIAGRSDAFVTPALLDVTGIAAPDEEIFAPVVQIIRVPHFDAAIAEANGTRFGLAAGLVTGDDALWERFALEVRAGVVNRNRPTTGASGSLPFGGLGDSGNHRPSAFYAADYCAYPMASFEAPSAAGNWDAIKAQLRP